VSTFRLGSEERPKLGLLERDFNSGNLKITGARGRARTCDLLIRSQTLYPTELRAHL
jgi:hypothetical protein